MSEKRKKFAKKTVLNIIIKVFTFDFENWMADLIKSILNLQAVKEIQPDFSVLKIIPRDLAKAAQILIFSTPKRKHLKALTTNNHPEEVRRILHQLENKGLVTEVFYTTVEGFDFAMERYSQMQNQAEQIAQKHLEQQKAEWKSAIDLIQEFFEQREDKDPWDFIKEMIRLAFQSWASDLHFQSEDEGIQMKIRLDGVLHSLVLFSHQEFWKYMQKIKFISGVKMNIEYLPQDGRFSFEASDRNWVQKKVDARINFMPGIKSENVVIRFLDASKTIDHFEEIGFSAYHIALLKKYMQKTTGIIIITGPTGSGKTTTLYTILKQLNDWTKKIITLEDPIEYKISGIQQSQINYDKWYDYETGLKAILRQDPDIILVWETRTKETAQIAINAALTWHLVFTTLHTNSVLDSLSRLMNMWVEPYLLTPALQLVIGQRLVRKACPHCSTREDATPEENAEILAHLGHIQKFHPDFWSSYQGKVLRTKWCEHCNHSGYSWRIAILELLEITDDLRAKILNNPYGQDLTEIVKESDFLPLQDDGILKVISWETTLEEIHRVSY